MLDYGQMFSQFIRILKFIWKILKPPLMWTGLIYPTVLFFVAGFAEWQPHIMWWISAWVLMAYTLIQNIARKITRDPYLQLYKSALGVAANRSEKKALNPPIPKKMSFEEPRGVVFGEKKKRFVCKDETIDGHVLVVGGPGSGKSSCVAIPTLMSWKQAIFAIDIKGELAEKTAKKREKYKIFSLKSEDFGYNPFYCIDPEGNVMQQIRDIAIALCPVPPGEKDPYWKQSAQNYLTGAMLFAYNANLSFAEIMRIVKKTPPAELTEKICSGEDEDAILFMNQFYGMADDTLSGIYSEVSNASLVFATDVQLRETLDKPKDRCILPSDLDENISLYIQLEEHQLEQMKNFLTLLVNQFLKHFEKRSEKNSNRILFLLDEFARLGKIDSILNGLATLRSKGITVALIFQSLAQLDVIYGKEQRKVICDNCSYWAVLQVNDGESQKYIADSIGTYDRTKKSISSNKGDFKALGSKGVSISQEEKRIVKPEELARLHGELIMLTPYGYLRMRKTPYYNTPIFS